MGLSLSRSINIEDEPIDKEYVYEKFRDESRPVREMKVTTEEMDKAMIWRERRDYCAHHFMDYLKCKREYFPNMFECRSIAHQFQHCTQNDVKQTMKEYERAKRLMAREKRRNAENAIEVD